MCCKRVLPTTHEKPDSKFIECGGCERPTLKPEMVTKSPLAIMVSF